MAAARDKSLAKDLAEMLRGTYPDIEVTVEHSTRWGRMSASFRCAAFEGLLPEERYERLLRIIPEEFRTSRMGGFVWLELAPGETIDGFLKLPRSEDVGPRERDIYADLSAVGFFDKLRKAMGRDATKSCKGDLSATTTVLTATPDRLQDAKLLFIRHGAYCDCQALLTVATELEKTYAAKAR
jgi:hypothetical protein